MIKPAALVAAALVAVGCASEPDEVVVRSHLVYTRTVAPGEKAIWIGSADGRSMRRLTVGEYGLVSPDGSVVAIAGIAETRTIGSDGAGEQIVGAGRPEGWLPDSRHLLVRLAGVLASVDTVDGDSAILVHGVHLLRGWSVSPDGNRIAYGLAKATGRWGCRDDVDIYVVNRDGSSRRRLTRDGGSSDPLWRDGQIFFARQPVTPRCALPRAGLWTMRDDGTEVRPIVRRAPKRFAWNGYYGLRPHGLLADTAMLLAGVRSEWGDELAVLDVRSGRIRHPDLDPRPRYRRRMYVDHVSRDGHHVLGSPCATEEPCFVVIYSVLERRARTAARGRVAAAHWNR